MRRAPTIALVCLLAAGCTAAVAPADEAPSWKDVEGGVEITAAPDAGGVLSSRNCPTLEEAHAAVPAIADGPDPNAVPFKSMVLQCSYEVPGIDTEGHPAGVSVLVFDGEAEGRSAFEWTLDPDMGSPTPIEGLGDAAWWTAGRGGVEVWVNDGRFGLHLLHTSGDALGVEELAALGRASVAALERPPR
ncbi:MAG TPA: hypothetical protein VFY23_00370 [Candidatus Limnocylindrales bacterium]|nr:hypothetical protein [Candidatus Limnocylindrales bacterium]